MTEAIVFTIPHRLVRLNEYIRVERQKHWAPAAKLKKDQTALCRLYVPKIKEPIDYPIEITYVWTVANFSNDEDNVSFGRKFINDAMQQAGLIRKDNLMVIRDTRQKFVKGKDEQVKVIVRRWEDDE